MEHFAQAASETFELLEPWQGAFLTRRGSLIGGLECTGINRDTLSREEVAFYTLDDITHLQTLPRHMTLWRFLVHADGEEIRIKRRSDKFCDYLGRARQASLNASLYTTRLFWCFEVHPDTTSASRKWSAFVHDLLRGHPNAWGHWRAKSLLRHQRVLLEGQLAILQDLLAVTTARWQGFMQCRPLVENELWAVFRLLATADQRKLTTALNEAVPEVDAGSHLLDGDVSRVKSDDPAARGYSFLRFDGMDVRYARLASITKLPDKPKPGMLSELPSRGSYAIVTAWSPYSELQRDLLLYRKAVQIKQGNVSVIKSFLGKYEDRMNRETMPQRIKDRLDLIEKAESSPQILGKVHIFAYAFGATPGEVRATSLALSKALDQSAIRYVWESHGAFPTYAAMIPGGLHQAHTHIDTDLGVAAEASLLYAPHKGAPRIEFNGDDEPVMFFRNRLGGLLPMPPEVEGIAFNTIVGRIGSGKSLLMNALAANGMKHGTLTVMAGIDPGNEPLTAVFGNKAGLFRLDKGMNVFAPCQGHNDRLFIVHFIQLVAQFIKTNEAEELRHFTARDELDLRLGLKALLRRPREDWQLTQLASYLQPGLRDKLSNWLQAADIRESGFYADLFDCKRDGPGLVTQPLTVYNLMAYKDDPIAFKALLAAMFYRIRLAFESRQFLDRRKHLYVDEGHAWLELPEAQRFIIKGKRTGRKSRFGMTIATQSAEDFGAIPQWDALRSALATVVIFPDARANEDIYKGVFRLTDGEIEAVRTMQPHREFLMIQRDIGLSQVAIHDVEPGAEVIYTSKPDEVLRRDAVLADNLASYELDEALMRTYAFMKGQDKKPMPLRSVA
jgi:hypothetical protein